MGFVIFFLASLAVVCIIVQWYSVRPDKSNELPPLVIPLAVDPSQTVPEWHLAPPVPPTPSAPKPAVQTPPPAPEPVMKHASHTMARPVAAQAPLKVVRDFPEFVNVADLNEPAPGETVRFRRPGDEPVQLLPGRLEVLSGDPRHDEIRFVRVPGRPAELILGRDPGDSVQHVTLRSATVSRQHARFAFTNGRWVVANLSLTNPVVLNDQELSAHDGTRDLADGDRLELGEVVLRFHAR